MCSEWGFVAHLSRIFFISSHSSFRDLGPKPTLADLLRWQVFCLRSGVSNIKSRRLTEVLKSR